MQCYSFLSNYYARLFEVKEKNRGILRIKNRNDGSSFLCSTDFQINRHTHKHTQTLTRPWTLYVFIRTNVFRDEEVSIYVYKRPLSLLFHILPSWLTTAFTSRFCHMLSIARSPGWTFLAEYF